MAADKETQRDKLLGAFYGLALGDALGVPHEFRYQKDKYTGILEHLGKHQSRWFPQPQYTVVGQVSDDTEMTLALTKCIIDNKGWNRDEVIKAYQKWANSTGRLGNNTRLLFKGVKTVKGYENRYKKALDGTLKGMKYKNLGEVQSNGSLMRCLPLIFVSGRELEEDIKLSNPNPVNIECGRVYINLMKQLFYGRPLCIQVSNAKVSESLRMKNRDLKNCGAWILHAIWCATTVLRTKMTFGTAMDYIINKEGDTDTNAAITGAMLGMKLGLKKMLECKRTKRNLEILLNANTQHGDFPRPEEYTPQKIAGMVESLLTTFCHK